MTVQERIAKLRKRMEAYGIDIYIVPTADYHQSECDFVRKIQLT